MKLLQFIIFSVVLLSSPSICGQVKKTEPSLTRVLFVFDASNSMKTKHKNTTRINGAKELFYKFLDSLNKQKNMQFALRMYGHTVKYPPGDCKDSKLVVPFGKNNVALIKSKVAEAKPTGITPIEHSLTESANDFPYKASTGLKVTEVNPPHLRDDAIAAAEAEVVRLEALMATDAVASDAARLAEIWTKQLPGAKTKVEQVYARWEFLEAKKLGSS
jgi:hypothetical protein